MAIEGVYRVGIYILSDINTIETLNPGIYRDDFLAVTSVNPQQTEKTWNPCRRSCEPMYISKIKSECGIAQLGHPLFV